MLVSVPHLKHIGDYVMDGLRRASTEFGPLPLSLGRASRHSTDPLLLRGGAVVVALEVVGYSSVMASSLEVEATLWFEVPTPAPLGTL